MPVARLVLALLVILLGSACGSTRGAVSGDSSALLRSVLPNRVPAVVEEHRSADVVAPQLAILAEVRRIRDEGVTPAELRRAVTVAEARHEFSIETAEGRARALGRAATLWRVEDELAYLSRVRSVTREHVRAVTHRYLDPDRYVRLALVPPSP